ncbi:MAG: hypothetical protein COA58_04930 [Bacteroidetes bacterium]|nr:MAG: hypothetical protein COA58_04930 [Bacteroidota bacterium]
MKKYFYLAVIALSMVACSEKEVMEKAPEKARGDHYVEDGRGGHTEVIVLKGDYVSAGDDGNGEPIIWDCLTSDAICTIGIIWIWDSDPVGPYMGDPDIRLYEKGDLTIDPDGQEIVYSDVNFTVKSNINEPSVSYRVTILP